MKVEHYLALAMKEAQKAIERNDEPYGAVIISPKGEILSICGNQENTDCNPTHHAEILAIGEASKKLNSKNLTGCSIVTNYKPCCMCASAILMTGISKIYIGSNFDGFDVLFEQASQKVKTNHFENKQNGLNHEKCKALVEEGRKRLKSKNQNYTSGHLNGIL